MRERVAIFLNGLQRRATSVSAILAMAIKAGGALLTLAIFTAAARSMNPEEFGRLAIWFNAISFLAVASVFGQDTFIARSFGEYAGKNEYRRAWGAYRFGWVMTIASGTVFVIAVLTIGPALFPEACRSTLTAPAFFLFTQTILHYSSHSTRAIVGFLVSEVSRELIWRVTLLAAVIWGALRGSLAPSEFFAAAGFGQILSFLVAVAYVRRSPRPPGESAINGDELRLWLSRSLPMWQSAILEAANLYVDVILIGYVASSAEAGSYFAVARIANVFLMVGSGLNSYTFAHSAKLYYSGQTQKLQGILRSIVALSAAMLVPMLAIIYVFGASLLTVFGSRYGADYLTLLVLATGCFLISGCGSASVILLTTGQEKIYSRVIGMATIARVALTALLAWRFGALGAACSWVLVNVPLFVLLSVICYRRIGVDPSILSLIGPALDKGLAVLRDVLAGGRRNPTQG